MGDLIFNVNVSSNLSEDIYEAVEKIKKVLSTPLSDYVSVEISTDDAGAGR
ncbi:hypothetical protein PAECIP111892_05465 [Paenibacillus auburnensis]|uniref:Uncharacterized protein n=1 Tax=Paenibacillus auburnensis TaxID=2905649 RepID=A0ABN8H114_9BACL|nr:hypothetical protein [Paenibacillus auburnensis]CAH1224295.1 hypothetical protein PAECIP111892_05465 [Paenibacillus auburnensis]